MSKPNCETCVFWEEESKTSDLGECRRHAPHPVPRKKGMELFHDVSFPLTSMVHWCGEHKPLTTAPAPATQPDTPAK